jgi:tRNA nucleotidyltransferase (CCA-adding enzyme)
MSGITTRWEHFPHGADIGVRGIGATKEEAFAQAALALTAVVTDPATVAAEEMVPMTCEAPDDELLFVDWLNAVVYEMATRRMLFGRFFVQLNGSSLHAEAWGEPVDIAKHQPAVEVKGATYTELKIIQTANGAWSAQCVVDV